MQGQAQAQAQGGAKPQQGTTRPKVHKNFEELYRAIATRFPEVVDKINWEVPLREIPKLFNSIYENIGEIKALRLLSEIYKIGFINFPDTQKLDQKVVSGEIVVDINLINNPQVTLFGCWEKSSVPVQITVKGQKHTCFLCRYPLSPFRHQLAKKIVLAPLWVIHHLLMKVKFSQFISQGTVLPTWFDPEGFLNYLIAYARATRSSDIHIFFEDSEQVTKVMFRMDGVPRIVEEIPNVGRSTSDFHSRIANKIFTWAGKDSTSNAELVDGSFSRPLPDGSMISIRMSGIPILKESDREYAPSIVLRLLKSAAREKVPTLEELGYSPQSFTLLKRNIRIPHGLILVTGPTGSGKTTTLYSVLIEKTKEDLNVLSVEDPVEVQLPGVRQVEINPERKVTFANVLRSFLRHDPDVILVGEIRDKETAGIAIEAALTGHLVFATVHVNDSLSVVSRFVETFGVNLRLFMDALQFVLSQRLARKLCQHCKQEIVPEEEGEEFLKKYGYLFENGRKIWKPVGCGKCGGTGYSGRRPIYEMLTFTQDLKDEILEAIAHARAFPRERAFELAGKERGIPFRDCVMQYLYGGEISIQEAEKILGPLARV